MSQYFNPLYNPLSQLVQQSQSDWERMRLLQLQQSGSSLNTKLLNEVEEKEFNNHLLLLEDVC